MCHMEEPHVGSVVCYIRFAASATCNLDRFVTRIKITRREREWEAKTKNDLKGAGRHMKGKLYVMLFVSVCVCILKKKTIMIYKY